MLAMRLALIWPLDSDFFFLKAKKKSFVLGSFVQIICMLGLCIKCKTVWEFYLLVMLRKEKPMTV